MKLIDFPKRFDSEETCEKYLKELREKEGLVCPICGGKKHYWDKTRKCWHCCSCKHDTTLTSGTVMHGSKLPLTYWFTAIHLLTSMKKTISAAEMQRQLGHKRYQPIWEMMHKLRSIMGARDDNYKLEGTIELDEGYFTTENSEPEEDLKRGIGSQCQAKVLVMVESEEPTAKDKKKKGSKSRKCAHIKMHVFQDLKFDTFQEATEESVNPDSSVIMDYIPGHSGVEKVVAESQRQTVSGKEAPKVLPWVHLAISKAKSLFKDMYHGIKADYLQLYLDEFCYKFNRMYFGDRLFNRLMIASVTRRSIFEHRLYNSNRDIN